MIGHQIELFRSYLLETGIPDVWTRALVSVTVLSILSLVAIMTDYLTRKLVVTILKAYIGKSRNTFDDALLSRRFFHRLAHIVPAIIVYYSIFHAFETIGLVSFVRSLTLIYIAVVSAMLIDSFLDALHDQYLTTPLAKDKPIKGYLQVIKILAYIVAFIFIISLISKTNPLKLLAGLGALAAVILLVFKDTILGLVASVQISANDLVKPGDWIEMPSRGADGSVTEINLHTVKVENWDKTIITIPTYSLVSESFQNWRGMEQSGGRRIKRNILIDMRSVKFLDDKLKNELLRIQLIREYILSREQEIQKFNEANQVDKDMPVNGRRMTNLGVFRKYLLEYISKNPKINKEMSLMVRHLQPTPNGIPIEIYAFSLDKKWVDYETVQADIFDHVLAIVPYFELKIFQNPSGEDFRELAALAGNHAGEQL